MIGIAAQAWHTERVFILTAYGRSKYSCALSFWANYPDKSVYKVIKHLETMEEWTHDDDEAVNQAVDALGAALDQLGGKPIANPAELLRVLAYLRTSRYLSILQNIDTASPGAASKIIAHAERNPDEHPANALFLNAMWPSNG